MGLGQILGKQGEKFDINEGVRIRLAEMKRESKDYPDTTSVIAYIRYVLDVTSRIITNIVLMIDTELFGSRKE